MFVPTRALLQSLVKGFGNDTFTSTAKLSNSILMLLNADFTPGVNLAWGDVTAKLANFDGYAMHIISSWTAPFIGEGELSIMEADTKIWQPTGHATPNTIYGHILVGSDSVTLLAAEKFDAPIPLPNETYAFADAPRFGLDPAANYGLSVVAP